MKKILFLCCLMVVVQTAATAQNTAVAVAATPKKPASAAVIAAMRPAEDSLRMILDSLANESSRDTLGRLKGYWLGEEQNEKRRLMSQRLARTLVRSLKTTNSFDYPFDSLKNYLSIVEPDDHSFRIFTWPVISLKYNKDNPASTEETYAYYGAIQINSPELQLLGLYDKSSSLPSPEFEITTNENWYGCTYYGIVTKTAPDGKKIYTLFGWDGNTVRNTRKLLEALTFDENGQPTFGAPVFSIITEDGKQRKTKNRFLLEYKKTATANLRYEADEDVIIFDHLSKEENAGSGVSDQGASYVPDGQYFGLKFDKGVWVDQGVVMRQYLQSAPVVRPVFGAGAKDNGGSVVPTKKTGKTKKKDNK